MRLVALFCLVSFGAYAADDAPRVQEVDGGVFVPSEVRIQEGKVAAAKDARIQYLESHLDSNIPVWLVITIAVVAAGAAAGTTFGVCKSTAAGCK